MDAHNYHDSQAAWMGATAGQPRSLTRMDRDTTGHFFHKRILETLLPVLREQARWVTFGDGAYGADGAFLVEHGQSVVCTDIQDETLRYAAERGWITQYRKENAEKLSFANDQFDWGLCKEALHHMPRPAMAFYEMLRVCRSGVALIEPIEREATSRRGRFALPLLETLYPSKYTFEVSGNFVFTLTTREVEKMLLGIGLRWYAFRSIPFVYIDGIEQERYPGPLARRIAATERRQAIKSRIAGVSEGLGVFLLFKNASVIPPDLAMHGFRVGELPANPHLAAPTEAAARSLAAQRATRAP
jgi:SAM-dependent methyltransferase